MNTQEELKHRHAAMKSLSLVASARVEKLEDLYGITRKVGDGDWPKRFDAVVARVTRMHEEDKKLKGELHASKLAEGLRSRELEEIRTFIKQERIEIGVPIKQERIKIGAPAVDVIAFISKEVHTLFAEQQTAFDADMVLIRVRRALGMVLLAESSQILSGVVQAVQKLVVERNHMDAVLASICDILDVPEKVEGDDLVLVSRVYQAVRAAALEAARVLQEKELLASQLSSCRSTLEGERERGE